MEKRMLILQQGYHISAFQRSEVRGNSVLCDLFRPTGQGLWGAPHGTPEGMNECNGVTHSPMLKNVGLRESDLRRHAFSDLRR